MNERHFNFYDSQGRLPNQPLLHHKLENNGFEKEKGKYILTAPNFGVPVTSILLLMEEANKNLLRIQNELNSTYKDTFLPIQFQELQNKLDISGLISATTWDYKNKLEVDNFTTSSGSTTFCEARLYIPREPRMDYRFSEHLKTTKPNIFIGSDYILEKIPHSPDNLPKPYLIEVYKNLMMYFEFSYALSERITNHEIKTFKLLTNNKTIRFINSSGQFASNIMQRGTYTHSNFMNFSVSTNNDLMVDEKKVVDITNKGLDSACKWVNEVYSIMLKSLN
jgi:hypothetical protein